MVDYDIERDFHSKLQYSRSQVLDIIENHEEYGFDPGHVTRRIKMKCKGKFIENEITPLLSACRSKQPNIAMALIKTGKSRPDVIGYNSITALIEACSGKVIDSSIEEYNAMSQVALAIIATGESKPDHVPGKLFGTATPTALLFAINTHRYDVALAIIATGKSLPNYIDDMNLTPLLHLCMTYEDKRRDDWRDDPDSDDEINESDPSLFLGSTEHLFEDVVIALIETGKSLPGRIFKGRNAVDYLIKAKRYNTAYYALRAIAWRKRRIVLL